jgi:hypothetical protein
MLRVSYDCFLFFAFLDVFQMFCNIAIKLHEKTPHQPTIEKLGIEQRALK